MNKYNKFKEGLYFGIGMTIFFIIQSLLDSDNLTYKEIAKSIFLGLLSGTISGILFGWIMGLFIKSKWVEQTTKITIEVDESLLFETPANHFKGIEGIGGKLYLTNKRLVFKSHKLNIQNHQLSINLVDIFSVTRYKPMGIVNNGLLITTNQNVTEKFIVERAEEWIQQLSSTNNGLQHAL